MGTVSKTTKTFIPFLCILPAFILILIFKIYPIALTIMSSFVNNSNFGFQNYVNLLEDPSFWKSMWVTFKFNIITTPLQIVLAIFMALLVNTKIKGITVFRTIFYLPVTISMTIATILWSLMLNPNTGIVNSVINIFGIAKQPFLISEQQALLCIVVIASWKGVGYWMMFLLAGLQNIGREIYESATMDGANWWKTTAKITLPLIKKVLLFVIVADTTANLLLFAPMFMITKGGPNLSTNVLMYEAYKSSFLFVDGDRAVSIVTILLVVIAGIVALQFKLMNTDDTSKEGKAK